MIIQAVQFSLELFRIQWPIDIELQRTREDTRRQRPALALEFIPYHSIEMSAIEQNGQAKAHPEHEHPAEQRPAETETFAWGRAFPAV